MSFDYGEPIYEATEESITTYTGVGKKTLLLDADFICYLVGFSSDMTEYLSFLREDKRESKVWKEKIIHMKQTIQKAVRLSGCDSVILFFTDSSKNFRIDIAKTVPYKGQREEEKPPFFNEAKEYLCALPNARLSNGNEADDEISIEAWRRIRLLSEEGVELNEHQYKMFADFVISSQDKDLDIIPSQHCHPTSGLTYWASELGELNAKYKDVEVNDYAYDPVMIKAYTMQGTGEFFAKGPRKGQEKQERVRIADVPHATKTKRRVVGKKKSQVMKKVYGTGLHFFYSQLLTGDTVDNYNGLNGVGMTSAYELLANSKSEQELFDKVYSLYKEKLGEGAFTYLLEQGQLAWMQTYEGELWHPKERGLVYE